MSREKEERGAKKKMFDREPRMLGFYPVLFLSEMEFLIIILIF